MRRGIAIISKISLRHTAIYSRYLSIDPANKQRDDEILRLLISKFYLC
ncbi:MULTISPECIES: hypothetical protein [unclassified Wolbachia]|nr:MULTISPECIES: hypothetical protein [unclassified Wolbachia]